MAQIVPVGVLRDDGAFLCWRGWRPGFPGEEVGTSEDPSRRAPGALSCPLLQGVLAAQTAGGVYCTEAAGRGHGVFLPDASHSGVKKCK